MVGIDVKNRSSINNYQKKKKEDSINNHRSEFLEEIDVTAIYVLKIKIYKLFLFKILHVLIYYSP